MYPSTTKVHLLFLLFCRGGGERERVREEEARLGSRSIDGRKNGIQKVSLSLSLSYFLSPLYARMLVARSSPSSLLTWPPRREGTARGTTPQRRGSCSPPTPLMPTKKSPTQSSRSSPARRGRDRPRRSRRATAASWLGGEEGWREERRVTLLSEEKRGTHEKEEK